MAIAEGKEGWVLPVFVLLMFIVCYYLFGNTPSRQGGSKKIRLYRK